MSLHRLFKKDVQVIIMHVSDDNLHVHEHKQ